MLIKVLFNADWGGRLRMGARVTLNLMMFMQIYWNELLIDV